MENRLVSYGVVLSRVVLFVKRQDTTEAEGEG